MTLTGTTFYLDTSVYRHLVAPGRADLYQIIRGNRSRIRLVADTVLELIEDLYTCKSEAAFRERRQAVELARLIAGKAILPADGWFLVKKLFDPSAQKAAESGKQAKKWLDVVVRYRSKDDVGRPVPYIIGHVILDVQDIARRLQKMRSAYVRMLDRYKGEIMRKAGFVSEEVRRTKVTGPYASAINRYFRSDDWKITYVKILARAVGASVASDTEALQLSKRIQIASEFSGTILRQSLCEGYKYELKANDALDEAHLRYLCDGSLVFVTDDKKLRKKIPETSRGRVINLQELVTELNA